MSSPEEVEEMDSISTDTRGVDVVPRRSTRARQPPSWVRSGKYALSHITEEPDWMARVRYLEHLTNAGTLQDTAPDITKAFLNILTCQNTE